MRAEFVQLLNEEELLSTLDAIYRCRPYWSRKSELLYTLGEAAYQHGDEMEKYYCAAAALNPLLWKELAWLYKKLINALSILVGAPVLFYRSIALPGFHIFLFADSTSYDGGGAHFDLPYLDMDWPPDVVVDSADAFSFTLPIRIPSAGASIEFWNLHYAQFATSLAQAELLRTSERIGSLSYQYSCGQLGVFFGIYWHRIAPMRDVHAGDSRITLQGHCLRLNDQWIAYW